MDYEIEDPDDEQFSVDEMFDQMKKTKSEYRVKPTYKSSPIKTGTTKKSPSSAAHGSQLIQKYFPPIQKPTASSTSANTSSPIDISTSESQEKRPRSLLVAALDEDYNPKCAKTERELTVGAAQKCDTDSGISDTQQVSPTGSQTQNLSHDRTTTPPPTYAQALENEHQEEVTKKKKSSKIKIPVNPFASPHYIQTPMDQDGGEINTEKPDSDGKDLNNTRMSEDLFDDSTGSPKKSELSDNDDDTSTTKNSPTPSYVNDRPRGQFKYQTPRSAEKISPSNSTFYSSPSSGGTLTQSDSDLIGSIDQQNSDLNTEADQMKALNVTSDK